MSRVISLALVALAACSSDRTDPPPRGIDAPARDSGATEAGAAIDAGDVRDAASDVVEDAATDARVDPPECTASPPSAPAAGLVLAAYSIAGFSGTQGRCGWSYGYIAPATSTSFVPMTEYAAASETWYVQEGQYWTYLDREATHPNGTLTSGGRLAVEQWSVRRWTSNVGGPIRITGTVKKAVGATGGNGVVARMLAGSNKLFDQTIVDEAGSTFDVQTTVAVGTTLDFVIDPNGGDDGDDSTSFRVAIWR